MNDNESILAELRKISAWADMQRKATKRALIAVAIFVPAMIIFGVLMERRVTKAMEDTAWMRASWPFACLKADTESVDFRLLFKHYKLTRGDVIEFSRYRYMFTRGLRIVHRREDLPKLLLFYSVNGYETLMQLLQKLGYTVKETCSAL